MSQKGSGAAKLHDIFVQTIGALRTYANGVGQDMIIRKSAGTWFVPGDPEAVQTSAKAVADCTPVDYWPGDPLDIKGIAHAFDRSEINANYMDIHKDMGSSGTTGSAGVLKQQLDYVSSAERAYRLRHLTPVRCMMHHTVRRTGHAHEQGVFATVLDDVVDNLKVSSRT